MCYIRTPPPPPVISSSYITRDNFPSKHTPGIFATAFAAAGYYHTCVLVNGGAIKCWGLNDHGQLGIGSTAQQNSPVDVSLGSGCREAVLERSACQVGV